MRESGTVRLAERRTDMAFSPKVAAALQKITDAEIAAYGELRSISLIIAIARKPLDVEIGNALPRLANAIMLACCELASNAAMIPDGELEDVCLEVRAVGSRVHIELMGHPHITSPSLANLSTEDFPAIIRRNHQMIRAT